LGKEKPAFNRLESGFVILDSLMFSMSQNVTFWVKPPGKPQLAQVSF
jgi:hypothetical protein